MHVLRHWACHAYSLGASAWARHSLRLHSRWPHQPFLRIVLFDAAEYSLILPLIPYVFSHMLSCDAWAQRRGLLRAQVACLPHQPFSCTLSVRAVLRRMYGISGTVRYLNFGPIEKYFMISVTSACARRTGAAARVER